MQTKKTINASSDTLGYISNKTVLSSSPKNSINPYQRPLNFNFNSPKNVAQKPIQFTGKTTPKNNEETPKAKNYSRIEFEQNNNLARNNSIPSNVKYDFNTPTQSTQNNPLPNSVRNSQHQLGVLDKKGQQLPEKEQQLDFQTKHGYSAKNKEVAPESVLRTKKDMQIITDLNTLVANLRRSLESRSSTTKNQLHYQASDSPLKKSQKSLSPAKKGLLNNKSFEFGSMVVQNNKGLLNRTQLEDKRNGQIDSSRWNTGLNGYENSASERIRIKTDESDRTPTSSSRPKGMTVLNKLLAQVSDKTPRSKDKTLTSKERSNKTSSNLFISKELSNSVTQIGETNSRSKVKYNNFINGASDLAVGVGSEDKPRNRQSDHASEKYIALGVNRPGTSNRVSAEQIRRAETPTESTNNFTRVESSNQIRESKKQNVPNQQLKFNSATKNDALQGFVSNINPGDLLSSIVTKVHSKNEKQINGQNEKNLQENGRSIGNSKMIRYGLDDNEISKPRDLASLQTKSARTNAELTSKYQQSASNDRASYGRPHSTNKGVSSSQELKGAKVFINLGKGTTALSKPESKESLESNSQSLRPAPFIYYVTSLRKHLTTQNERDYFCQLYKEHLLQSYQALNFIRYMKPIDSKVHTQKKVSLPRRPGYQDKKTLVFDLDETLIHCNENTSIPYDVKLPIKFPQGGIIEAGINIRPYAVECLRELSQYFEIIVFTASHGCYANVVLDYLDPKEQYIHHRLFRESCVQTEEGVYVKDLRILANRDLSNVVLVDNAAYSFGFQIENGIPILPFYYNKKDQELRHLMGYLKYLANVKDVREINRQTFGLHLYMNYETPEKLIASLKNGTEK